MRAVDYAVEQLWEPALAKSADLRAVVGPSPDASWRTVEAYWLMPRAATARLLVPVAPRTVTRRSLTNYRRLRSARTNLARSALGALAAAGLPLSASRLEVQVRARASGDAAALLPLRQLSAHLGIRVYASAGVRTSDNRKTMLHLVDRAGRPVGYAKFGWNAPSDALVATEADALTELGGRDGPMRAPALLGRFDYHGHPVTVTAPLPHDVRGWPVGTTPTAQQLFGLTPISRRAPVGETAQLGAVLQRLRQGTDTTHVAALVRHALAVGKAVGAHQTLLPVSAWWHGDLAPWNSALGRDGQFWVWDWENAERDAVAGLDALHWTFSQRRLRARDVNRLSLTAALAEAHPYLAALGIAPSDRPVIAAHYALTTVERACTLACHAGSWAESLIAERGLRHLLDEALELLSGPPTSRSTAVTTT